MVHEYEYETKQQKDINVENSFYMKFIIKIDLEKRKTLHQQLTLGVFLPL